MFKKYSDEGLPTNRIEGLSDGVFGIAMTLLIFKIDVPDVILHGNINDQLAKKLFDMLPQFENYFLSFILLGIYWIRHQLQFKHIKEADRNLLWINIFFLVFVGLLPFSTGILMKYTGLEVAQFLYSLNLLFIGLALAVHWRYASKDYRLINKDLPKDYIKASSLLIYSVPVVFLVCCLIALFSPRASLTFMYLIPIMFAVAKFFEKRRKRI